MTETTKKMTNSEAQTFQDCKRKWWLSYYMKYGLPREVTGVRAVGTRLHAALSAYYSSTPQDPFVVLEQTIAEDILVVGTEDSEQMDTLLKEADLVRIILEGYVEWLQETGADQGLQIVADEQKIEVPSAIEGVSLMGKLDLRVVRETDGARLFMDHKTVGSINESTKMLHMDRQMKHYHLLEFLLALSEGQDADEAIVCDGGIYNMLRKVKRTARAKPPFYERVEVRHNRETLRSYFIHVHAVINEILECERRLDAGEDPRAVCYPTPTRDCTWKCDFFAVCPMFDDGSDAAGYLDSTFVQIDPNIRYAEVDGEETT